MPKTFTSQSQKTGELAERIACIYLENKGFSIVERNYTKKWGEIDIVAQKGSMLHFVEVKSKSVVDCRYIRIDDYRPEENMHYHKVERLKRTMQTYLLEREYRGDWQFDLAVVYLAQASREAKVVLLPNLIL